MFNLKRVLLCVASTLMMLLVLPITASHAASVKVRQSPSNGTTLTINVGKKYSNKIVIVDYQVASTSKKPSRVLTKRVTKIRTNSKGVASVCGNAIIPAKATVRVRFRSTTLVSRKLRSAVVLSKCGENSASQLPSTTPTTPPTESVELLDSPTALELKSVSDTGVSDSDRITNATTLEVTGVAPAGSTVQLRVDNANVGSPCNVNSAGQFECSLTGVAEGTRVITAVASMGTRTSSTSTGLTVTVDRTAPTVAIVPERESIGSGATVSVSLNASEELAYFTIDDVAIYCAGTCDTSALTKSGNTYSFDLIATEIATDIYMELDFGGFSDLAGNDFAAGALSVIELDQYGPQASLQIINGDTMRLTFNEAPSGLEVEDFQVAQWTSDCWSFSNRSTFEPGVGMSNLRMVDSNPRVWDMDMDSNLQTSWRDGPFFLKLEIAGSYSDEWGNASDDFTDQPEMDISDWSHRCS